MRIVSLLSEASAAKEKLKRELSDVHEALVAQIYRVRQQSIDTLNDIEKASRPGGEDGLAEIDMLLARIDSICNSSTNVTQERVNLVILLFF